MLPFPAFTKKFEEMQARTIAATQACADSIKPGVSESELAERFALCLRHEGLTDYWYPILVYSGRSTGLPISRRYHLPSSEVFVRENDIVMLDSTPIMQTVWSNWSETFVVGTDGFYASLLADTKSVVDETAEFAKANAHNIGEVFDFCNARIASLGLISLDPRNDVGHSIFQVPEGQTVEMTPMSDRLFISEEYRAHPIDGILSIEPQVGRKNPNDGKMYSAKLQSIIVRGPVD